ncbi:MAG: hypothetical protein ACREEH_01180, partial [Caulobacteraceae bacterium]
PVQIAHDAMRLPRPTSAPDYDLGAVLANRGAAAGPRQIVMEGFRWRPRARRADGRPGRRALGRRSRGEAAPPLNNVMADRKCRPPMNTGRAGEHGSPGQAPVRAARNIGGADARQ